MAKDYKEWILQAEYDYETAKFMFDSGRYFYAVFMCHLSLEKALKGIYHKKIGKIPPKIHSLNYFIEKLNLNPTEENQKFFDSMDDAGIATRYPDSLKIISQNYKKKNTLDIINKTREILEWIKEELIKL